MTRTILTTAALLLIVPSGLSASAVSVSVASAQPIFAAMQLSAGAVPKPKRCGGFEIVRAIYRGTSTSPDVRLAGTVVMTARIAINARGSSGIATGTLVVRDRTRRVRMRATVRAVVSQKTTINGLVWGTLHRPNALLDANVTMVFDEVLRFGVVRLGMESGANSAVARPVVPRRC